MYIVKQKVNGKDYFYIRKSVREGEKVHSTLVCYGGKTREDAERKLNELNSEKENNKNEFLEKGTEEKKQITIEELANFCKSKGFVYPSSAIYGGLAGFWDFGPLGVELFNNLKQDWWNFFVKQRENMVGIEASIISHPKTWKASGHITNFNVNDYLVVCKNCKKSSKIDKPDLEKIKCPNCSGEFDWANAKIVEQMFKTKVGSEQTEVYLRGETAQGMFLDFKQIMQTSRMPLPFGIAQIGRCFRNEIAPRDFLFRSREFHIGEFEFFIHPEEKKCSLLGEEQLKLNIKILDEETQKLNSNELKDTTIGNILNNGRIDERHAYWLAEQIRWFYSLGLKKIKIREHTKEELSHYSSATFDIDYEYPFGSKEVAGNANRGQYDLTQHQKASNESMEVFDEQTKSKIIPRVIEPTFGMERVFLALLTKSYCYDSSRQNIVLKLPAKFAPYKAAVFPIVKNPEYEEIAEKLVKELREEWNIMYDKSGSVGRRYARNDEIGTPMCITIDDKSVSDKTATIRDRDTTEQIVVRISEIKKIIKEVIQGKNLISLGKIIKTRIKK